MYFKLIFIDCPQEKTQQFIFIFKKKFQYCWSLVKLLVKQVRRRKLLHDAFNQSKL